MEAREVKSGMVLKMQRISKVGGGCRREAVKREKLRQEEHEEN